MKIYILPDVYQKIMYFVDKTDFEVSGFGVVEHVKSQNIFVVKSCHLIKQENTSVHTDIDGQDLARLMYDTRTLEGSLRFWWHSHVNMGAFWSSQDINTIKELGANGWITAAVFNKKREHKAAVCWQSQSELGSTLQINDNIDLVVGTPHLDSSLIDAWNAEFSEKVTEKKYAAHAWSPQEHAHDYNSGYWTQETKNKKEKKYEAGSLTHEFLKHGIMGYGAVREAVALNMSYEKYERICVYGTDQDYDDVLTELRLLEQAGFFSTVSEATC